MQACADIAATGCEIVQTEKVQRNNIKATSDMTFIDISNFSYH